jgi:hypothetical protein
MARKPHLTAEEKEQKKKEIDESRVHFRPDKSLLEKIDKFRKDKSRNEIIIKLINSNPEFKAFKPS